MFIVVDIQTIFHMQFVGMLMAEFYTLGSSGSSA
jgi:hypothetical protein